MIVRICDVFFSSLMYPTKFPLTFFHTSSHTFTSNNLYESDGTLVAGVCGVPGVSLIASLLLLLLLTISLQTLSVRPQPRPTSCCWSTAPGASDASTSKPSATSSLAWSAYSTSDLTESRLVIFLLLLLFRHLLLPSLPVLSVLLCHYY